MDHSNALALIPDRIPRSHLVGPKLAVMEKRIVELDLVLSKLVRVHLRKCSAKSLTSCAGKAVSSHECYNRKYGQYFI
jgi:hypothetical protein